jgi:predicted DNA-binding ribbon-helix-helix protein
MVSRRVKGKQESKSAIPKRSVIIAGRKTSISVENAFWRGLKEIAGGRDITLSKLVAAINSERKHQNLSSAVRLFVLDYYRRHVAAKFRVAAELRKRVVRKERH